MDPDCEEVHVVFEQVEGEHTYVFRGAKQKIQREGKRYLFVNVQCSGTYRDVQVIKKYSSGVPGPLCQTTVTSLSYSPSPTPSPPHHRFISISVSLVWIHLHSLEVSQASLSSRFCYLFRSKVCKFFFQKDNNDWEIKVTAASEGFYRQQWHPLKRPSGKFFKFSATEVRKNYVAALNFSKEQVTSRR